MGQSVTRSGSFSQTLTRFVESFDSRFSSFLEGTQDAPGQLSEAMRYSALAPGKRVRPFLVTECCRLAGGSAEAAFRPAMAVECVHAFSLVHDDLPAMDNQELRRGRPTNHVRSGEAMAVLAGDALLTLAFEVLAGDGSDASRALALVRELALATGREGMIAGQVADMDGERRPPDRRLVDYIHERKTGRLIRGACRMGVIAAGGDSKTLDRLSAYGSHLGGLFQIADDLLDATATTAQAGKGVGKDREAGKQTYPACVGIVESRKAAREAAGRAIALLAPLGEEGRTLHELVDFILERVGGPDGAMHGTA